MRIVELVDMAKQYLILGGVGAMLLCMVLLFGYFIIYKKLCHGEKRITKRMVIGCGILFCYLVVVAGATLLRGSYNAGSFCPYLFQSYRSAWNNFSVVEWQNIILNILMFVPLGFLLPCIFKKMRSFVKVTLTGLGMTLFIESMQFWGQQGIFELDDILDNTLGAMIGYGIYVLLCYVTQCIAKKERTELKKVLLLQLPLLIVVCTFTIIFVRYETQEFGNLIDYSYRVNLSDASVEVKAELSEENATSWVYSSIVGTKEEVREVAQDYFTSVGAEIDDEKTIYYSETVVYYSKDNRYSVWVDYNGLTSSFTDFDDMESEGSTGLTREEVEEKLNVFSISHLELAEFSEQQNGTYRFETELAKTGDVFVDGWLNCTIGGNGQVQRIDNHLIVYEQVKEVELISTEEACQKIQDGKFEYYYTLEPIKSLVIEKFSLGYSRDTKGFYQPVYCVDAKINGKEWGIRIPARR